MEAPLSDGTFTRLFPDATVTSVQASVAEAEPLYPEEEACIAGSAEKRRRDFTLGRACARAALTRLGLRPGAIPAGPGRAPVWPDGVRGTITHCDGLAAAAVTARGGVAAMGLDAEVVDRLTPEVVHRVCTEAERAWLSTHHAPAGAHWSKVVFGAKEAVYKAVSPLTGEWLGFHDVEIDLDPQAGRFGVRFVGKPAPPPVQAGILSGRFTFAGGLVLAAVILEAR